MQPQTVRIEPGATVQASDGFLGTVERVITRPETGEPGYLVVWRGVNTEQLTIPISLVGTVRNPNEVTLRSTIAEARQQAQRMSPEAANFYTEDNALHVPLIEERLEVSKRTVTTGEVLIHKTVETYEDGTTLPLTRDDVTVERVPINQQIAAPVQQRTEGDTLIIPVMQEVLVVEKRLMLVEEIRIRKNPVTQDQQVRETLRRERVEIEQPNAVTPPAAQPQPQA